MRWLGFFLFLIALVTGLSSVSRAGRQLVQRVTNERAAVASLRKIVQAQEAFAAECGGGTYSTSLMDLATRPPQKPEGYLSWRRGQLGWSLVSPVQGYIFTIWPGRGATAGANDCNDFPTQTRYYAVAVPIAQGNTGDRRFAVTQDGVIWQREGLMAPAEPFGSPSSRVP